MNINKFKSFLIQLGFSTEEILSTDNYSFFYEINTTPDISSQRQLFIPYFYFQETEQLFQNHLTLWNQNNCQSFIAIFDDKIHIVDSRQKPDSLSPLAQRVIIKTFDYGINTETYNIKENLHLISKEGINTSEYFNFVIEHQRKVKAHEVDKDLLLNLLALRKDLSSKPNDTIDLLLLRCLFVKYLEDRGAFPPDTLFNALSSRSPEVIIKTFSKVRKINGDLFNRKEFANGDIRPSYLEKLSDFFGYTDYQKKQTKFFPYQFDKIPIQLISHIYESFLSEETRKGSGVYYTSSFLVDFMLSQTLQNKLKENRETTVLDPACGSGTFLVSAFQMMIKAINIENDYNKKKEILQTQLFGIDLDERALQIAAFSLYLALLEGEKSEFIQEKIKNKAPILPSLISKTLLCANALADNIVFEIPNKKIISTFDCIVANPPWGSVPNDGTEENLKTRSVLDNNKIYRNISDYQRSQAFLLGTTKWSHEKTVAAMVVNNSIFFNEHAEGFRKDFLNTYKLEKFYELSNVNSILFKKRPIGKIKNKKIEVGTNEPCCVAIYKNEKGKNNFLKYISPKINKLSEELRLITYNSKDVVEVKQSDLLQEDLLWKIFANGNWSEYQIIKKRIIEHDKNIKIKCDVGFIPKKNMKKLGVPKYRRLIDVQDFVQYSFKKKKFNKFNWNQELHRNRKDERIYKDPRILFPVRPLKSDELRFRGIFVSGDYVFKDNIACLRIYRDGNLIKDYRPYLAIINSKFIGFLFFTISSQWGKGNKRVRLNTTAIENIPFPKVNSSDLKIKTLSQLVDKIKITKHDDDIERRKLETKIDEIVFDLYNLSEYERTVVNEFYELFYRQSNPIVNRTDLDCYAKSFSKVFHLMLNDDSDLTFKTNISLNLGSIVRFTIQNKRTKTFKDQTDLSSIRTIVKNIQTKYSYLMSVLSEEKVKYYDKKNNQFYIIKSNQFRDWTSRQAIDDANEEIQDIIKYLKKK